MFNLNFNYDYKNLNSSLVLLKFYKFKFNLNQNTIDFFRENFQIELYINDFKSQYENGYISKKEVFERIVNLSINDIEKIDNFLKTSGVIHQQFFNEILGIRN
jgi:hypothetical protein